ncbi:MAG: superoxide dismutase family protein [Thiohalocapsa sp.]|nr:superoxide dismutase family protein [Thiohalocapsa sp.]
MSVTHVINRPLYGAMLAAALTGGIVLSGTAAADVAVAEASIKNLDGETIGTAVLRETDAGVLLHVKLAGLPPGVHGFHIHEKGKCEPPFATAGGHLTVDDSEHGYFKAQGPHAGDMPNIHVPESGELELEVLTGVEELEPQLFDADGASLVIHRGADDYRSQPSGDAGERIACGVIEAK